VNTTVRWPSDRIVGIRDPFAQATIYLRHNDVSTVFYVPEREALRRAAELAAIIRPGSFLIVYGPDSRDSWQLPT
jgi:hypothetical protein